MHLVYPANTKLKLIDAKPDFRTIPNVHGKRDVNRECACLYLCGCHSNP